MDQNKPDMTVRGFVCPRCGGKLFYAWNQRANGEIYKVAAVKRSKRQIASDDSQEFLSSSDGFRNSQSGIVYEHRATMICPNCNAAFSQGQVLREGQWQPKTEPLKATEQTQEMAC